MGDVRITARDTSPGSHSKTFVSKTHVAVQLSTGPIVVHDLFVSYTGTTGAWVCLFDSLAIPAIADVPHADAVFGLKASAAVISGAVGRQFVNGCWVCVVNGVTGTADADTPPTLSFGYAGV